MQSQLEDLYSRRGCTVQTVASAEAAIERLAQNDVDAVVTEVRLPGMDGGALVAHIQQNYPDVPVIAVSKCADIETAVSVLKHGAKDFLIKPLNLPAVEESMCAALEKTRVYMEIRHLRRSLADGAQFGGILSKAPEMHHVFDIIRRVAPTDMTVLIEGETGTGKELVASAIHHHSPRKNGQFVTINCAGFPESLLESELFGHEKGDFTGADQTRRGKIEQADEGTLFLDEIESMSIVMQSKLLRVLERQEMQRLGGRSTIHVDMRVIAASNVSVKELVDQERMRNDFYYRINVIPIHLIPLRERRLDIPLLIHDFLHHHDVAINKGVTGVSKRVLGQFMDYDWPGNIRELQNVLERAIILAEGNIIDAVDPMQGSSRDSERELFAGMPLNRWLREQEKQYLMHKLKAYEGNVGLTAKRCGIGVRTLSRKIRLYGLDRRQVNGGLQNGSRNETEE
jgi:DNA-binding NtrC family response regulator